MVSVSPGAGLERFAPVDTLIMCRFHQRFTGPVARAFLPSLLVVLVAVATVFAATPASSPGGELPLAARDRDKKKDDEKKKSADAACEAKLEEIRENFDRNRGAEIQERILQIGQFVNAPCDATVKFLAGLFDSEENAGIHMAITEVLGRIGSEKAVQVIVTEAAPALTGDSFNALAVARALENPLAGAAEQWLLLRGMRSKSLRRNKEVWERVVLAVTKFSHPQRVTVLVRELASRKTAPAVQVAILEGLESVEDKNLVAIAGKLVYSKDPTVKIAAMRLLFRQGGKKNTKIFVSGLRNADWQVRLLSLRTLAKLEHKKTIEYATHLLADRDYRVQVNAVRVLYKIAKPEVIPPLIAHMDKSSGRVKDDILDALTRLTGVDLGPAGFQWEGWWEQNAKKFKTLKPLNAEEFAELKAKAEEAGTAAYHGLRILSDRFVFIVDSSESMNEEYVPRDDRTKKKKRRTKVDPGDLKKKKLSKKIDVEKKELRKVLQGLPDGKRIDIIRFESVITDFVRDALGQGGKNLVPLTRQSRAAAVKFVDAAEAAGQTYMLKALETAFANEDVDTIYLLSDGAPTPQETAGMKVILDRVQSMNLVRAIKINTIGIDLETDTEEFMRELAEENFGVFMKR